MVAVGADEEVVRLAPCRAQLVQQGDFAVEGFGVQEAEVGGVRGGGSLDLWPVGFGDD